MKKAAEGHMAAQMSIYDTASGTNFQEQIFFLAKASAFESPLTLEKYPLELSVAAFSIRRGVVDCFSTLIDHDYMQENIPSGCGYVVKVAAEEFALPLAGDPMYKKYTIGNCGTMLIKLEAFMNHHVKYVGGKRYLMAMPSDVQIVTDSLENLFEIAKVQGQVNDEMEQFITCVEVLDFSKLLYRCATKVRAMKPEYNHHMLEFSLIPLAENLLNSSKYDYEVNITCNYHAQDHIVSKADKCTMNNVLRRAFLFIEEMISGLSIEPTRNHLIKRFVQGHKTRKLSKMVMLSSGDLQENSSSYYK